MRALAALAIALAAQAQTPERDFVRPTPGLPVPPALSKRLEALDEGRLQASVRWLADPAREGRGLGTRGLDATATWIERRLRALGLPPLGRTYRQEVPLRVVWPGPGSVRLTAGTFSRTFVAGKDAVLPTGEPGVLEGAWVDAGLGIQEPALGHDDYRGRSVRGQGVVLRPGLPEGAAWQRADLKEAYDPPRAGDRYDRRLALAERLGARAVVALEPGLAGRLAAGGQQPTPAFLDAPGVARSGEPPLVRLDASHDLLAAVAAAGQGELRILTGGTVRPLWSRNVLARLEGSDPRLKHEAVLLGAHMDHLGLTGGQVHPGADDNASGVAALLEIARAFAQGPRPRRTLLFAFWTGEEEGKFGSSHYVRHPRWPLARTVAYLNLDMVGHPWTSAELRTLATEAMAPPGFLEGLDPAAFAEPGLPPGHPELGRLLREAGQAAGLALHLDWTDGRNGGSDYRGFARRGLPFVRFFGSYFPEYHTPGDTPERVEPAQVRRMAALVLATAWLLAEH